MDREQLPWWLRRVARQLSHFEVLSLDVAPWGDLLSGMEVESDLVSGRRDAPASLDAKVGAAVRGVLDAQGVMKRLEQRGFEPEVSVTSDPAGRHTLRITDGEGGPVLAETVARFATIEPRATEPAPHVGRLDVIVLDWLLLQDPRASFSAKRPPLPGQQYPGLGAGQRALDLLDLVARQLRRDAVFAFPSHYHNAVLAQGTFTFLDPARQGELLALQRALEDLTLAEASWAIELALVTEPMGTPYRWGAEEMGHATGQRLAAHFGSKGFEERVEETAAALAFDVDAEAARAHVARLVDQR